MSEYSLELTATFMTFEVFPTYILVKNMNKKWTLQWVFSKDVFSLSFNKNVSANKIHKELVCH